MKGRRSGNYGTSEDEPHGPISQSDVLTAFGSAPCDHRRLLIVDDQEPIRLLLQRFVAQSLPYCRTDSAATGAEAIKLFHNGHHGIIMLDIHMPEMNGEDVFHAMEAHCRRRHWQMPSVLFLSGYTAPDSVAAIVMHNRGHGVLSKPVARADLLEALKHRMAGP